MDFSWTQLETILARWKKDLKSSFNRKRVYSNYHIVKKSRIFYPGKLTITEMYWTVTSNAIDTEP